MILDRTKTKSTLWLTLAAVVAHLLLCRLPLINQEWAFADAARYFETHQQDFLDRYFSVQANTLGLPLLAYLIHKVMPFIEIGSIPRLLAILGFIFMGAALVRTNRLAGGKINRAILLAAVFLNPLIWTFGGRGTADFLPAALTLYSLSLFCDRERKFVELGIAIITFDIAVTLKYHAIVLLPIVWAATLIDAEVKRKQVCFQLVGTTCLILLLPICYLFAVKENFGFWLAPPAFQNMHHIDFSRSFLISNLVAYMGYLTLLCLPLSGVFVGQSARSF